MKIKGTIGVLICIVIAQFFCTSLWFAGNAVSKELLALFEGNSEMLGHLTAAVQLGFIFGTLVYAFFTIPDRFSPSKVFMISAFLGALSTLAMLPDGQTFAGILTSRFFTGFFLAGIYPVGMKIAADYFDHGLGKALGFLVGALVLGTAFPHFIRAFSLTLSWKVVIVSAAVLCMLGGLSIGLFVKDGPYRKKGSKMRFTGFKEVFGDHKFRSAAFGYFGHMWELYAFWAFVPVMIALYRNQAPLFDMSGSLLSFFVIGIGCLSCFLAGWISQRFTAKKTAFTALLISGICCVLSPIIYSLSAVVFIIFLLIWGCAVIADSPMFSTLVAQNAPPALKGSALTLVNCIGFSITIVSIEMLGYLNFSFPDSHFIFMALLPGPVFGLWALTRKPKT
jgi:MFS family permease